CVCADGEQGSQVCLGGAGFSLCARNGSACIAAVTSLPDAGPDAGPDGGRSDGGLGDGGSVPSKGTYTLQLSAFPDLYRGQPLHLKLKQASGNAVFGHY